MENKFINRYNTFCKSLSNLAKSKTADPKTDFVLEGTVLNFSLTFDISWKVMKDILIKKMGILDFAVGSPRETLQQAFTNGIIDDDTWLQMLKSRNHLCPYKHIHQQIYLFLLLDMCRFLLFSAYHLKTLKKLNRNASLSVRCSNSNVGNLSFIKHDLHSRIACHCAVLTGNGGYISIQL